ncbi:hypothetical protein EDB85DRAFT_1890103 [Lactarius pseudohatsudake]|nr:hypothetical protein EDB85DRAFT_1890103 [Lactarius pseudohatsudake]
MSAESALNHAEVDYREGNIDSKIRQHLTAPSQEHSEESLARFIMAIDLKGSLFYAILQINIPVQVYFLRAVDKEGQTASMPIHLLALHLSLSQRPLAEVVGQEA